jgi:uncharacterized delta-60 repeat protein
VDSAPDTATITASTANSAPVADAGIDQNVSIGDMVTLDGSGSTDADGDILSYTWSFNSVPPGSAVVNASLSDTNIVNPTFVADVAGSYVAQLIVNDGTVDSATDTVTVTATTPTTPTGPVGTLDTTFDSDGVVLGGPTVGNSVAVDESFGTIFVAGAGPNTNPTITRTSMYLWKYTAAGSPDTGFGNNSGIAIWDNPNGADSAASAYGVTLDSNGNIYVAGYTMDGLPPNPAPDVRQMAIWKFYPNGTPYTPFNNGGIVLKTGTLGGNSDYGYDIAIDDLLNIYVTGMSAGDMVVWKYDQNGALDTSFGGGNGYFSHGNAAGGNNLDGGYAISLDSGGNIYVTGHSVGSGTYDDMVVWKLTPDGELDTSFGGGDGFIVDASAAGANSSDAGRDIIVDDTGKIYVTGYSSAIDPIGTGTITHRDMVIWKLNNDGSFDNTFNSNGIVVDKSAAGGSIYANDAGEGISLDSSGNIYVTGWSAGNVGNDIILWKYSPNGSKDTTFGSNGVAVYDSGISDNTGDQGFGLTLEGDNKAIVTGRQPGNMVILKYE